VVKIRCNRTKRLLARSTALLPIVSWNPVLRVQPRVVNERICLGARYVVAARALELLPDVRVLHRRLLVKRNINNVGVQCRHVVKKCRLLNKAPRAVLALVGKVLLGLSSVALDVIVHSVLLLERTSTILVLAHKVPSSVFYVIDGHLCNPSDILKLAPCDFNFYEKAY